MTNAGRRSTISTRTEHAVLLATGNRHKIQEIQAILAEYPIRWHTLSEFPDLTEPDETGASYLENAVLKARYYAQATGLPALADDSGLEVDALGGQPGLYSARFAGHDTPHSVKILKVLELLDRVPEADRTARFLCVAALVEPGHAAEPIAWEGVVEGQICREPAGEGGFGYDPIFWIEAHQKTMAELPETTKNRLSHRAKALLGLMQELGWAPGVD